MNNPTTKLFNIFFYVLLTYSLLLVLPISFQATLPYLDSSWAYDLNYFLHSRFHFGPDLIFTYGPLGFLNNPQHVGHDIGVAVFVHAIFWIALGAQLVSIWRSGERAVALAYCVSLALGHRMYYDYWDYNVLALSLITFVKLFRHPPTYLDLSLLPVLLGIGFLLKFTAYSTMVLMLVAYASYLIFGQSVSRFRVLWLGICFISGPVAYLIYDPSIIGLFQYVKGELQVATGFTTAMSLDSDPRDWKLLAFICFLILLNLMIGIWKRRLLWGESLIVVLIMWSVFRHGFVRGGSAHAALFFGFSILISATLFAGWRRWISGQPFQDRIQEVTLLASFAAITCAALSGFAVRYPVFTASNWEPTQSFNDLKFLFQPVGLTYALDHGSDEMFANLPGMAFRDSIEGKRVMVFPNGTPYVAKINFEMFPIYALQNYSAYTAYLDNKGARNLLRANPPVDKILLEWTDIDGRNVALDTPAMILAFLSDFVLESRAPNALLLSHREVALPIKLDLINNQHFVADEWVQVPYRNQLVAMSIRLKQTLVGTLRTNLFDQDIVNIELATQSGPVKHFRIPPQTLSTPGLINYVPDSLDDLQKLWSSEALSNRVLKIRLTGPGLRWITSKGYSFYQVENAGVLLSN